MRRDLQKTIWYSMLKKCKETLKNNNNKKTVDLNE